MTDKTYAYTINHEIKHIFLPPPSVAGDIGSPPSWACYARNCRFTKYFVGYSNSILTRESWEKHIEENTVLTINSNQMENK